MHFITAFSARLIQSLFIGRFAYSSAAAFLIVNIIPPAGILFLGWDFRMILFSYLVEFGVYAFFITLHILMLGEDSFFFESWWVPKKIILAIGVFLFIMIFDAPFLLTALPASGEDTTQYYAAASALTAAGAFSFARNFRTARRYHVEFFFQLLGPRFMLFTAALGAGWILSAKFPSASGIAILLPVAAAKTLLDYAYERSGYLKLYSDAYRLKR